MSKPSIVSTAPGQQARVQREGRTWVAYRWCDCILGPHWHKLAATAASHEKLIRKLRDEAEEAHDAAGEAWQEAAYQPGVSDPAETSGPRGPA